MDKNQFQLHRGVNGENGVLFIYSTTIFLLLASMLFAIDFVPKQQISEANSDQLLVNSHKVTMGQDGSMTGVGYGYKDAAVFDESNVPTRIRIDSIGLDTPILTPSDTRIDVLDRALLQGAVLYPGSGTLGDVSNMLIFGHSSYLPVVKNKAYRAFNKLHTLSVGEVVHVDSTTHRYTYRVNSVFLKEADQIRVEFTASVPTLTLATCNTFGDKEERWVVTAVLLSKEKIY